MGAARRLRILEITLGRRGGVTEYGWLMGRALTAHADVAVVYSALADNRAKWATIECPRLGVRTYAGIWEALLSLLAFWRFVRIWRFAHRFRPDVIYYPGGHPWKLFLDLLLPRSAITVLTVHDPHLHEGEDFVWWRLLRWTNQAHVTGFVLLNQAQKSEFVARFGLKLKRVIVIPHGIFDDYSGEAGEAGDVTDLTGLALSDIGRYFLFIGRIRPYKGLRILLDAYQMLPPGEAGPLVIAGSGDLSDVERKILGTLEGRPVYFVNAWLSESQVAALVSSARFVVLPYQSATQSGVIPLASAFGVPAIASAVDGLLEQVVDGRTGLLVPPGDAVALRGILAKAYGLGEDDYRLLSNQCRDFAIANWGWERLSNRLVRFCETLSHDD